MGLSGVHRTQISEYERGVAIPQVDIVDRLSRGLKVPIGHLLAGIGWQDPKKAKRTEG